MIQNDDDPAVLSINAVSGTQQEGSSVGGYTDFVYRVVRDGEAPAGNITVRWAVSSWPAA